MKKINLLCTALIASASASQGAIILAKIHDVTASNTQNYTFSDGAGSITLQAVYTTTNNGVDGGAFTSLDGGLRVGNSADLAGDSANHFTSIGASDREGFRVTISLVNATNVDTSSIAFSFDSLGVRELAGETDFTWASSASAAATTAVSNNTTGALESLDTGTYGNIENVDYTGTFSIATVASGQYLQLSDEVAGNNGIVMTANFTVVPEPSSTALLGLGGLALILRRRK